MNLLRTCLKKIMIKICVALIKKSCMVPIPGLFARVVAYWAYPVLSGHVLDWRRRTRTHCRRSWEIVTTFPRCPGDAAQSRSLRLNLATGSPRRSWACWYPNKDRLRTCMSVRTFCCDQLYIKHIF